MKIFSFIILAILFSGFSLLADDYAHVDEVTMSSSFNDFNAVKAAVKMTIGDAQIKGEGDYVVYYWDGDSWEDPYEDNFWNPPLPIWGTIQYDDDVYIVGIADNGNGSFRVIFRATADQAMHVSGYSNFSVTDVVAPAAPANFAGSWSGNHPQISWSESNAADFKEYVIEKKGINAGWIEYETITNKNTTSFVDATEDKFSIGGYLKGYVYYRMKQKDMTNNTSPLTASESFAVNVLNNVDKAVDDALVLKVDDFALMDNYPNPFNPTTHISFNLPSAEYVTLEVYDVNGKKVNTLVSEYKEAGNYTVEFNGQSLPSGLYFCKIKAGKFSSIKRMLLVK